MEKEEMLQEITKRYNGRLLTAGTIVEIVFEAAEMLRQETERRQLGQVMKLEERGK